MENASPKKDKPPRRFAFKIAVFLISIPLFILFSELFFTIIPVDTFFENHFFLLNRALDYPEIFKRDQHLFWRMRPSQTIESKFFEGKQFKINSDGLRGENIPPKSDKIRIVGIGNSCTFGWRVDNDKTYLNRLQKLINADSLLPKVEVINAGVPGYSSYQGRQFFQSDILTLKPDIVMLMFGWNDQWAASENIPDNKIEFPPQFLLDLHDLLARLKIYRFMRKLILSATEKSLDESLNKSHPVYRVSVDEFYDNYRAIAQTAEANNIELIILTSPIPSLEKYYPPGIKSNMHSYHEAYNDQARKIATEYNLGLIDLDKIFDKYDNLFDNVKNDPIHFNAAGHRVAAEEIFQYFSVQPEKLHPAD